MSSSSSKKRTKSFVIAAVFLVIAVASIVVGRGGSSLPSFGFSTGTHHVKGAISPELEAVFKDPATTKAMEKHDIELELDILPARDFVEGSSSLDKDYDFVLADPNGATWTSDVRDAHPDLAGRDDLSPMYFGKPLLVLVHSELVEDMRDHGLVAGYDNQAALDMETLVEMSQKDTRWRDISPSFGSPRVVDVAVPQVDQSFAALRYARVVHTAAASYAEKELGSDSKEKINAQADDIMRRLVADQGYGETTDQGILDAFLRVDKGEMPMVLTTAEQYLYLDRAGKDLSGYALLSLKPATKLSSIVLPRTDEGALFATAMDEDAIPAVAENLGLGSQNSDFVANIDPSDTYPIPVDGGDTTQLRWADYEEILRVVG